MNLAGHRVIMQKSIVFLYTSNKVLEDKIQTFYNVCLQ